MIIQHFKPSRAIIAGLMALLTITAALGASCFGSRAIDPRVTVEFGQRTAAQSAFPKQPVIATTIDGEVACTAERISEATALALSASLYAAREQLNGHAPHVSPELIAGLAARNLLPPGLRACYQL